MQGKICLITGASSGIGRVTALALARLGAEVWVLCRNPAQADTLTSQLRAESGNEAVYSLLGDLSDLSSVKSAAQDFLRQRSRLDVLINNAGIFEAHRRLTKDGFEAHLGINYLSHYLLSRLLLEALLQSEQGRLINVSSDAHQWAKLDIADLQLTKGFNMLRGYGNSKLAQLLFTYHLARQLVDKPLTVNALHPGVVATGIARRLWGADLFFKWGGRFFILTPEQGAATSLYLATSPAVSKVSGKYFEKSKSLNSSTTSYDTALDSQLWEASEKLVSPFLMVND